MGDPAGISPELTARGVMDTDVRAAARLIVIGDARILDEGARVAGLALDTQTVRTETDALAAASGERPVLVDLGHLALEDVRRGEATLAGGTFATENFRRALAMAKAGTVEAVCFTPFNKAANRQAYPGYDDENRFVCDVIGWQGSAREFNVLESIWNARVTSHIPLSAVASTITKDLILHELELTGQCLRQAGIAKPRVAVAALNPHAGDGGNFGREEIEVIEPAVEAAKAKGFDVVGPYPADTVYLRAPKEGCHAVLTMYHDQGQIAMKLMGFDRGVTMLGGLPFPICTPAHGTAYDIAGKGIANIGATRAALLLAARMAERARVGADAAA
ncbi:4-hydroxythreonine-4-phosphate dehydrogenase PdxA [Marinivivus vitaminiproducens]|uniref:4-hydroxythreonine-4-phosphate dehydrogenase PdxA n=1 Tax=Marinivivus vitaminiproducens TaxID=3035935 RepID=UPI003F9F7136